MSDTCTTLINVKLMVGERVTRPRPNFCFAAGVAGLRQQSAALAPAFPAKAHVLMPSLLRGRSEAEHEPGCLPTVRAALARGSVAAFPGPASPVQPRRLSQDRSTGNNN